MVIVAVDRIACVGGVEAIDYIGDPLGPVDRQRACMAASGPAQRRHLAESVDMIGVKVADKDAIDVAQRITHARQIANAIAAGVDQK